MPRVTLRAPGAGNQMVTRGVFRGSRRPIALRPTWLRSHPPQILDSQPPPRPVTPSPAQLTTEGRLFARSFYRWWFAQNMHPLVLPNDPPQTHLRWGFPAPHPTLRRDLVLLPLDDSSGPETAITTAIETDTNLRKVPKGDRSPFSRLKNRHA